MDRNIKDSGGLPLVVKTTNPKARSVGVILTEKIPLPDFKNQAGGFLYKNFNE